MKFIQILILLLVSITTSSTNSDLLVTSLSENKSETIKLNKINIFNDNLYTKKYKEPVIRLYSLNKRLLNIKINEWLTDTVKSDSTEIDCSKFTQDVFNSCDIKLPRTSYNQSLIGKYINLNDSKFGDLIFFASPDVKHVGIVISNVNNNIQFVHYSSTNDRIVKSNLTNYWKSKYEIFIKRLSHDKN